jgi:hypothetical protein
VLLEGWGSLLHIVFYSRKDSYPPSRAPGSGVQASCPNPIGGPVIRVYGQAVLHVANRGLLSWDGSYRINLLRRIFRPSLDSDFTLTITSRKLNLLRPGGVSILTCQPFAVVKGEANSSVST